MEKVEDKIFNACVYFEEVQTDCYICFQENPMFISRYGNDVWVNVVTQGDGKFPKEMDSYEARQLLEKLFDAAVDQVEMIGKITSVSVNLYDCYDKGDGMALRVKRNAARQA